MDRDIDKGFSMTSIKIRFENEIPKERLEELLMAIQAQCEEDEEGKPYGAFTIETED